MALLTCSFHSDVLGMASEMNVILPQTPGAGDLPVLYLLHGLSDDHTIWCRRTSIERYAAAYRLAVVMPNGHRSFYTDMQAGFRYGQFMTEELPAVVRGLFHVSARRQDTFVAGLSMGGYGALKLALSRPDRYAFAASLSGVADMGLWAREVAPARGDDYAVECQRIFGPLPGLPGSAHDLFRLSEELVASGEARPQLYCCCGSEDFLLAGNRTFHAHLQALGWDLTYEEAPGNHEWGFWDTHIQRVLELLPLP